MVVKSHLQALGLFVVALPWQSSPAIAEPPASGRVWTLDDAVAAPEVTDLAISGDGSRAAYLLRTVDLAKDQPIFELHIVNIRERHDRMVASSAFLSRLKRIPGQSSWSLLANFGQGLQLYRATDDGHISLIAESKTKVLVGSADGANFGYDEVPPMLVGIPFYDWSPDGKHLFYSTLEEMKADRRILTGAEVTAASARRRWSPQVKVSFYLRGETGEAVRIASAPTQDRVARYLGGLPKWSSNHIDYSLQAVDNPTPSAWQYRWQFGGSKSTLLPGGASLVAGEVPTGPHGGAISVTRIGGKPRLTEQLPNGTSIDYGAMNIALSGVGSHGFWRSADGAVVLAVRLLDEARYVLVRIDRDGKSTIFPAKNSLRHCAFTSDAMQGVCIHEGLVESPELVAVSTRTGSVRSVSEISPHYAAIKPLEMSTLSWTNSFGYTDNGFVIYPRGYRHGQRYPAIIITHSSDADQRFAAADLQWNYPAYLFAERGYVVLLVNDSSSFPSEALDRAQATWNSCDGRTPPWEVQRLIWLNTVESYRSLINRLNGEGLIDRDRLGIAGYSAGSQMVNVAVTQTHLFKAASSGDGAYLEPAANRYLQCSYRAVYGGAPGDPRAIPNYLALAPSYRARYTTTPVLQQLAEPRAGAVDFYQALQVAGVPTEITLYPGETPASDETHLFHIPSNRRAALVENLEWFDFWLRGKTPTSDPKRAARWKAMRSRAAVARKETD